MSNLPETLTAAGGKIDNPPPDKADSVPEKIGRLLGYVTLLAFALIILVVIVACIAAIGALL